MKFGPHCDTLVSCEVEQCVVEHAAVATGEHKAVAVEPAGVPRVEAEELVEEDVA
jgi:hypothetical protein